MSFPTDTAYERTQQNRDPVPAEPALLDRVHAALARDDRGTALELLVIAWQLSRAPALADLVDAIDAADPRAHPYSGSTRAWLAAAKKATHRERGRLIAGIQGRSMVDTQKLFLFAERWSDPRLTHELAALLSALPWVGPRARVLWHNLLGVASRLGDSRFVTLTSHVSDAWTVAGEERAWLERRLAETCATLGEPTVEHEEFAARHAARAEHAPEAGFVALARELRASLPSAVPSSSTAAALLAAVYAHPDDDAPRLVFADYLQERGDPRGDFIASQLQPERDAAARKRERVLLKQHKKMWLGELGHVVRGDVEFRRGFPYAATIAFRTQRDVERYAALAAWATFEELTWGHQLVRADQRAWSRYIGPAMANIVTARRPLLEHLLASASPWHRLRTLELDANELGALSVATIVRSPLFPALESLVITGWGSEPSWLAPVGPSSVLSGRCPPHLTISAGLDDPDRDAWLAAAANTGLVSLTLLQNATYHRFTREHPRAPFTRLDVAIRPAKRVRSLDPEPRAITELVTAVRRLPPGFLTHFDATIQTTYELSPVVSANYYASSKVRPR